MGEDRIDLPETAVLDDVFDNYANRVPRLRELRSSIVFAKNQQFSPGSDRLAEGDEIAFLPPVSGGSTQNYYALTREPIDTQILRKLVLEGSDGAIVDFVGVVRNNTKGRSTRYLD